jgi:hypothetical protein
VFPKNRCERAASGISPGTKKFFRKNVFHTKATPLWDRTIFGQVFVRGGMIKKSASDSKSTDTCRPSSDPKRIPSDGPPATDRRAICLPSLPAGRARDSEKLAGIRKSPAEAGPKGEGFRGEVLIRAETILA